VKEVEAIVRHPIAKALILTHIFLGLPVGSVEALEIVRNSIPFPGPFYKIHLSNVGKRQS
jgi:uncharacterized membrane protein